MLQIGQGKRYTDYTDWTSETINKSYSQNKGNPLQIINHLQIIQIGQGKPSTDYTDTTW